MMNKLIHRLLSAALAAALIAGLCLTASAFEYPNAYWALHKAWDEAVSAQNLDQIISVAQQTHDLLMAERGLCLDVCQNMEPKAQRASWACEVKGDIAGAITWSERQRTYSSWLNDQPGYNYTDQLQSIDARMEYLSAARSVTVYARSNDSASPYSAGPRTGAWYGTPMDSSRSDSNAALMYFNFNSGYSLSYWINYYSKESENFRKAADGGVIELAWNFTPESTAGSQAVLSADDYIAETLETLGGLNATILLRVGAEMNCWYDSDPEVYKQAFRKVASAARAYPNIQMVFSPNDIGNRDRTLGDYYPGDEYVDWVGMSTYHNTQFVSYDASKGVASYSLDYNKYYDDAYYGVGIYDHDPLVTIKPIIDLAAAHNKPVMISECGFSYREKATGQDLTGYAVKQLNWFYSYINMVYPQVKAVFYFDAANGESAYDYLLAESPTLNAAYETAIRENGAYLSDVKGTVTGWETLDKASLSGRSTLRLAAYASLPGQHDTTVRYYVDGEMVHSSSQVPFYYDLNLDALTPGSHTVRVEAEGGQFKTSSQTYTLRVKEADASPTNDRLTVNGELQDPTVYKIDGSNYFKIRDLAAVLNGTEKQFDVDYDGALQSVTAATGQPYRANGSELAGAAAGGSKTATISNDTIYIDGQKIDAAVYKIDGSNYFKLRDLGQALDFYVGWTQEDGVFIDTARPYEK